MVGFISKPTIEQEQEHLNQASKLRTFDSQLDSFDPKINDLYLVDSFLDFDSIEDWFEDNANPNRIGLDNLEFGIVEKGMEMVQEGSSEQTCFADQMSIGSKSTLDGSETTECRSTCPVKVKVKVKVDEEQVKADGTSGCNIVEEMGKVSLVGKSVTSTPVDGNCLVKSEAKRDEGESESGSESESESGSVSESESSSSSSDSSDSSSDDDEEEMEDKEKAEVKMDMTREETEAEQFEEGEIRSVDNDDEDESEDDECEKKEVDKDDDEDGLVDVDNEFGDLDYEDDDVAEHRTGPIKSKNELQELPPVPPVDVLLQPDHKMLPVGLVLSIIGTKVIVEGVEKHNPLNEGSILWITENRSPLGLVDEIFGPVKNPYYVVRYNSESEVPAGIQEGTLISFVQEFANHVLNDKNLYKKGYDASGENDEEILDEAEFSDDEKEAEYRRMQKMAKRSMNDQRPGNKKNDKKKVNKKDGAWKSGRQSSKQTQRRAGQQPSLPNQNQHQHHASPVAASLDHGGSSVTAQSAVGGTGVSSVMAQSAVGGRGLVPPFAQMPPTSGFITNGTWTNGMPCQQPYGTFFPNGFMSNGMPWLSQNHQPPPFPMPMPGPLPFQQQFDPSQRSLPTVLPGGQVNFFARPTYAAWAPHAGPNYINQTFGIGLQGQPAHGPINAGQGVLSNEMNAEHNRKPQESAERSGFFEAPQQVGAGAGASSQRGRKPYQRGVTRFTGGRGRQQYK